ncbi:MAG: hypothetical protein ABJO67_18405 [Pseudoruegeria sp.]
MKSINKIALVSAAIAVISTTAFAQVSGDADGDGQLSIEELQATYPNLTESEFLVLDQNGDGAVDVAEYTAAIDGGLLMPSEG